MIYMVTFTINIPPMLVYIYIITIHGSYGIVITRPGVSVRPDCNVSRLDEGPKPLCISRRKRLSQHVLAWTCRTYACEKNTCWRTHGS